jgi:hypothetical protein
MLSGTVGLASNVAASPPGLDLRVMGLEAPDVLRVEAPVDASACGEEAGAIVSRVEAVLRSSFAEASVLPGQASDPQLRVAILPFPDPENPGYTARLELVVEGAVVEGGQLELSCDLCTHGELADKVGEGSVGLLGRLRAHVTEPEAAPEGPEPEPAEDPTVTPDPVGDPDAGRPEKMGPLGFTGIALAVAGAGSLGGGAGLIALGDEDVDDGGLEVRRRKGPGFALVGVGATALLTGVALVVIDRVRAKKAAKH